MTSPSIHEQCDKLIELGEVPGAVISTNGITGVRAAKALKIALDFIEHLKEHERNMAKELFALGIMARDDGSIAEALEAIQKEFEP